MKQYTIKATILLENAFWVGVFERNDETGYSVARQIFGGEPTDPEIYEFISLHYQELKFTSPKEFTVVIKRKNPKRMKREVRAEMEGVKHSAKTTVSFAQEAMRLALEENKKLKKTQSKAEKEAEKQMKFLLKQEKRKEKHRGH